MADVARTTHPDHLFRANPENEFGYPERGFLHAIALVCQRGVDIWLGATAILAWRVAASRICLWL